MSSVSADDGRSGAMVGATFHTHSGFGQSTGFWLGESVASLFRTQMGLPIREKNQTLVLFVDAAIQYDSRKNAKNNSGFRGSLTDNQQEVIQNVALGVSWRSRLTGDWSSE